MSSWPSAFLLGDFLSFLLSSSSFCTEEIEHGTAEVRLVFAMVLFISYGINHRFHLEQGGVSGCGERSNRVYVHVL